MKKAILTTTTAIACAISIAAFSPRTIAATVQDDWQQLTSVGGGAQSRLAFSHWPNDKYPNLPELTAKSKTVLLDVDGPGLVTLFHVSKYQGGDQGKLVLRVWYDGEEKPSIEMPWMAWQRGLVRLFVGHGRRHLVRSLCRHHARGALEIGRLVHDAAVPRG